jgi:hypothetical protein
VSEASPRVVYTEKASCERGTLTGRADDERRTKRPKVLVAYTVLCNGGVTSRLLRGGARNT